MVKKAEDILDFIYREGIEEVGNIGAGNASKYLSELTGKKVEISVPEMKVFDTEKARENAKNCGQNNINVFINIASMNGSVAISMEKEHYNNFLDMVKTEKKGSKVQNMMDIAEHISRFYLEAVAEFLSLNLEFKEGKLLYMGEKTLVTYIVSQITDGKKEKGLVIENKFQIQEDICGKIIMLLGEDEIGRIKDALESIS